MRKSAILITGANGEIGRELIKSLPNDDLKIVTLDLTPFNDTISRSIYEEIIGSILDIEIINQLNMKYDIKIIYHLAAILSTKADDNPQRAHDVNVEGTLNLLNLALKEAKEKGETIKFFFPSSIAVYGLNDLKQKQLAGSITENNYLNPTTIYGCNKLYCENVGIYYSKKYQLFHEDKKISYIDFRSIRFPGIISPQTIPNGGTSDYLPEMIHAAAQGKQYKCFARKDAQLPFITMSDAIQAIHDLLSVQQHELNQGVYNIRAFSPTTEDFRIKVLEAFPEADIRYEINETRQNMIDSWPQDINDSAAKIDWNWNPKYDLESGFNKYLIPEIKKMYA